MVSLTTTQVETLVDILEDIDSQLKALGVAKVDAMSIYAACDY